MKQSILALVFLLMTLILTCVYEKTYTIYSADAPKELILIATPQSKNTIETAVVEKKKEKTSIPPVVSLPTPTKPVDLKPEPENKPISEYKSVEKTDKNVERESTTPTKSMKELIPFYQEMVRKEAIEKATSFTKNSTPKQTVATGTEKVITTTNTVTEKSKIGTKPKSKPVMLNSAEKAIVDYIMWAMNNRDIALKNRDEVEARIQELIIKAIQDRQVVLDERRKNKVALVKLKTELIDTRDASYESVTNPQITKQGKK